jgi:hypothetical protein
VYLGKRPLQKEEIASAKILKGGPGMFKEQEGSQEVCNGVLREVCRE